jgi:hypothetical protein
MPGALLEVAAHLLHGTAVADRPARSERRSRPEPHRRRPAEPPCLGMVRRCIHGRPPGSQTIANTGTSITGHLGPNERGPRGSSRLAACGSPCSRGVSRWVTSVINGTG